jgi:protein KRI1
LEELGVDLDGDWDPEKHDQQMAGLYERIEGEAGDDDDSSEDEEEEEEVGSLSALKFETDVNLNQVERPIWENDIDINDIISEAEPEAMASSSSKKKKKKDKKKGKDAEDADTDGGKGVDVDMMDADLVNGEGEGGGDEEWDGTEEMRKRKLDEYMEELYKLEFNDMVCPL